MSRFTLSSNFIEVVSIDREFGSRFNRYQGHGNFPLKHPLDGGGILEDICVVNPDRMSGPKAERPIHSLPSQKNDALNSRSELGMKHFESREIGQRAEGDVNHAPILPERSGQRLRGRGLNSEIFLRSRARIHPVNSATEASNQICCDRGRGAEGGVSISRANAGNSQIGAS